MRNDRGSILIPVLFLAGLLGIFAAIAANIMYAAADTSRGFAENIRAREAMIGAIEQIVGHAGSAALQMRGVATVPLTDARVTIRILNEAGRIDLNLAPAELLAGIFRMVSVQARDADVYAARIIDWRDTDDDQNERGGAEREMYRAAGRVDGPRNGPFLHVGELALVLGIPQRAAAAVAPYVTIAGRNTINPTTADPPVLMALPGMTEERVRRFLLERQRGVLASDALIAVLGQVQDYVTDETGQAVRFEGRVALGPNNERRFEALVAIADSDSEPYRILAWDANPPERIRTLQ